MTAQSEQPRLYGRWRPERGWGLGSLGTGQTLGVFGAVLAPVLAASLVPRLALPLAGTAAVLIVGLVVRIGGRTAAEVLLRRARFGVAQARGWTEFSAGVLSDHPRGHELPGVLAPLVPLDTDDGRGGRQALIWDQRTGTLSAVLRCAPVGLDLAEAGRADEWVAGWGAWLADLGHRPIVRQVAVTVSTTPGLAATANYLARRVRPDAPEAARRTMSELLGQAPAAAETATHVTVTLDPARAVPRPDDLLGGVAEATRWLPGLEAGLAGCGVAVLDREPVAGVTARVRAAFDPSARDEILDADDAELLLDWAEAAPVGAREEWGEYRHDSGVSVSWALQEAPRQAVTARVLVPLMAPGPFVRRVTWVYLPYPADAAAAHAEREVTAGHLRRSWAQRTRRDETHRDRDDRDRAELAAREEAEGAGLGRFTLYVTTTVEDPALLPAAVADVEQRGGAARLRLRRLWGAQAVGFAATLGLGVDPAGLAGRAR
ncbi:SCO6880 family protein [Pseudonocardia sp. H11422]|uniref:SCO6880 family protein n=1 Tax=Pseudonocardia sp. H11422 TaxID=2835866 RepID=UPI001BDCF2D6|nr:SCO6880 family protein [Pseudonocardia sp. H11422]